MFKGKRGVRGPKSWRYTLYQIAELTGRSYRVVRDDVYEERLKPDEFEDVVRYVAGYLIRRK